MSDILYDVSLPTIPPSLKNYPMAMYWVFRKLLDIFASFDRMPLLGQIYAYMLTCFGYTIAAEAHPGVLRRLLNYISLTRRSKKSIDLGG